MASEKPAAATVTDPDGREVVLLSGSGKTRSRATIPSWSIISKP